MELYRVVEFEVEEGHKYDSADSRRVWQEKYNQWKVAKEAEELMSSDGSLENKVAESHLSQISDSDIKSEDECSEPDCYEGGDKDAGQDKQPKQV